jgi:putative tricarboxylic transport membrane protein
MLVAACAVLYWMTAGFPEVPAMLSQNVPPTFFPRWVLLVTALLSVALIMRGMTLARAPKEPIKNRVWLTAGIITAAILLIEPLGMLLTVSLLAVVMPLAWGERRYRRLVILALALPLGIHLVFTLALGIRFPLGVLAAISS